MSEGTVLVTGASGFLASHIVQQLLQAGYKVRGTVRDPSNDIKCAPLRELDPEHADNLELVKADLTTPECWPDVVRGCTYVLHTASPFPIDNPSDPDVLIKPAVEGTTAVLKACHDVGGVKRVVLTSSVVAIASGHPEGPKDPQGGYTEEEWTVVDRKQAYPASKTLAERAAWDYVNGLDDSDPKKFELSVINPSFILGPQLCGGKGSSAEVICKILNREFPAIPDLGFSCVDVRDVALAHIRAMVSEKAAGNRYICSAQGMAMPEFGKILAAEFDDQGYNVPTKTMPYFILWIGALFDKALKTVLPQVGKKEGVNNSKIKADLNITFRPVPQAIIDTAYSCVEKGWAKKGKRYRGPPNQDTASSATGSSS